MARILIVGCGDIGSALALTLQQQGHEVTGLKRHTPKQDSLIRYIKADVTQPKELAALSFAYDQLLYILSPSSFEIDAYNAVFSTGLRNLFDRLSVKNPSLPITFVSSTRVYGQTQGEWLNECSITKPADERGKILLAAEKMVLSFNEQATVVRFSGIYGRSNRLLNQLTAGAAIQQQPSYYTNRIHRDDCIGVLDFIINKKTAQKLSGNIFLASDSDPVSKWDLAIYLCDKFNAEKPSPLLVNKGASANKRIDNSRLKQAGYVFKFDSYRQGYV